MCECRTGGCHSLFPAGGCRSTQARRTPLAVIYRHMERGRGTGEPTACTIVLLFQQGSKKLARIFRLVPSPTATAGATGQSHLIWFANTAEVSQRVHEGRHKACPYIAYTRAGARPGHAFRAASEDVDTFRCNCLDAIALPDRRADLTSGSQPVVFSLNCSRSSDRFLAATFSAGRRIYNRGNVIEAM